MIVAESLSKTFSQQNGVSFKAIDNLSLTIFKGEKVGIVGSTGCGKSTFLRIVLGVEQPSSGKLLIDGKEPYRHYSEFKGRISAVFQEDRLLPWRTAIENVVIGLEIMGVEKKTAFEKAMEWLNRLGLEKFAKAYPSELSGGMRQRVAIARALILNPEIILLDEAFGHLDEVTSRKLRADFFNILSDSKAIVVMVTHNLDEALESVDRIVVFGKPAKVLGDFKTDEYQRPRLKKLIQHLIETNKPFNLVQSGLGKV